MTTRSVFQEYIAILGVYALRKQSVKIYKAKSAGTTGRNSLIHY